MSWQASPQEAAGALLARRRARRDFGFFCETALQPFGLKPASHHHILIDALQWVAETPGARLMVFMPPGSAKSTYTSVLFPAWYMSRADGLNVIGASHTATLAEAFSGRVQSQFRENGALLGCGIASENVKRWSTTRRGEYLPAGVGGAVTGFRADLGIIDDPVKSREDADSETMREKAWAWFLADFRTRLKPGGRIALVMTRWHEDDLAGRLLMHQADQWRAIRLPALAEVDDPIGRAPGEPLWADDAYGYGAELLARRDEYEAAGATREWRALYQQSPTAGDGTLFKAAMIRTVDAAQAGGVTVRAWDLAATADAGGRDPDWTAGVKLTRHDDGSFTVLDVVRLRGGPEQVEAAIVNTAAQDGRGVGIGLPQDPGQAGKSQIAYLTRRLAGYRVESSPETGDKATRAAPAASQANVGNLALVKAPWNRAFLEELAAFPAGAKDDQVDAFSRAFAMVATRGATKISTLRL